MPWPGPTGQGFYEDLFPASLMMDTLAPWNIDGNRPRPDIFIPGSPERCVSRSVIEDESGALWVLERITTEQTERREAIARNLDRLNQAGFTRQAPYARTTAGRFVAEHDGQPYQLSPYLPGDPLPQPAYIDSPQRGRSLAGLLISLHDASQQLELEDACPGLALPPYIAGLTRTIHAREPEIGARLSPILATLEPFMEAYADLPVAFNHGDFHPINVIWNDEEASALIDWEFCGYRPQLFDAANLLGCVGIEDPQALTRALAPSLIKGLLEGGLATEDNMRWLPALIVAQRWAWFSEWLRKDDREMIALELDYLDLLSTNLGALGRAWKTI